MDWASPRIAGMRVAAWAREEGDPSGGAGGTPLLSPPPPGGSGRSTTPIPMPDDPEAYARLLYASPLHGLDDLGCDLILRGPPLQGSGVGGDQGGPVDPGRPGGK